MKTLHYKKYDTTAIVTGHLKDSDNSTIYIEMGGILTHVRAITSAMLLLTHRKRDSGITLDGDSIHLERHGHYKVFFSKAPNRKAHGITTKSILVHEMFTGLAHNPDDAVFHMLLPAGHDFDQPPPNFFERLRLAIDVPISFDWQTWLWQEAQKKDHGYKRHLIDVRKGYGVAMARIYTNTQAWLELVRTHLDLKCVFCKTANGFVSECGEWKIQRINDRQWTIYHNGEQVTMKKQDKTVPYLGISLGQTMGYAKENLGLAPMIREA